LNSLSDSFISFFLEHVVTGGEPLVLSHTTHDWPIDVTELFTLANLRRDMAHCVFAARDNLANCDTVDITVDEYCQYIASDRATAGDSLIYGKDLPCPPAWTAALERVLPPHWLANRGDDMFALLPDVLRPEVTLAYHGLPGTSTAGHFDICSSVGHNVMVWTDAPDACAYWFMVASRDRDAARAFWLAHGGNLDHDNALLSLDVLATAPFPIYVVEQRLGDFVLVNPDGAHQVINVGGSSMKVAWNRVPPVCLRFAHDRVLPKLRAQGKQEIYRIKTAAWFGLKRSVQLAERGELPPTRQTVQRLEELRRLVADNWAAEAIDDADLRQLSVGPLRAAPLASLSSPLVGGGGRGAAAASTTGARRNVGDETPESLCARVAEWRGATIVRDAEDGASHTRSCDFCRCDLWNRFWHCTVCASASTDYDLCLQCVAVGRGCSDDHFPHYALFETLAPAEVEALLAQSAATIERVRRLAARPTAASLAVRRVRAAQLDAAVRERAAHVADAAPSDLLRASACGMLCHQCGTYRPFELCVPCRCYVGAGAGSRAAACPVVFCEDCLWNTYHVTPMSCLTNAAWRSPVCAGACRCEPCRRTSKAPAPLRSPVMCELPFQMLHATGMLDAARLGVADTLPVNSKLVNPLLWFDVHHEANRREVQRRKAIQVAAIAARQPEAQPKVLTVLNDGAEFRPRAPAAEQMGVSPLSALFAREPRSSADAFSSGSVIAVLPPRRAHVPSGNGVTNVTVVAAESPMAASSIATSTASTVAGTVRSSPPPPPPPPPKATKTPSRKRPSPPSSSSFSPPVTVARERKRVAVVAALAVPMVNRERKRATAESSSSFTPPIALRRKMRAEAAAAAAAATVAQATPRTKAKPSSRAEWMMQASVPCSLYSRRETTPVEMLVDSRLLFAPMCDGRWFPCTRVVLTESLESERQALVRGFSARFVTRYDLNANSAQDVVPENGVDLVKFFGTQRFEWVHRYRRFEQQPREPGMRLGGELKSAVDAARRFASLNDGKVQKYALAYNRQASQ
jgi:hypothetical protein